MLNFEFYNPTRIIFGKDRFDEINRLVPENARVLITLGGGSARRSGLLDRVRANLGNRVVLEFSGIEPNPHYETLMKAAEMVRSENIDFILAVGGGSVIDGTKFIALAAYYEGNATDLLKYGFRKITSEIVKRVVPFGTVLTLPATGSEMNCGAVISYDHGKFPVMSDLAYPVFSILDPTVTFTLPGIQVANGIVDAFIHTTEQYITFPVNARLQDRMAEGILQTLIEIGSTTLNESENYDARANHVWCATMALNGLIGSGVPQDWATHMIGHELTAMFGIDHGQTLAIVLPALLKVRREQKREKLLQYAERIWNISEGTDDQRMDAAILRTREFFESLGIKTHLSDYGVTADKIPLLVEQLKAHGMTALSETGDLTLEISREILEAAM
ncbi:MAG: NADH-dependent alcohol dehydrogenase [Candidatus Wallbacteria bacterium HGW-Wallbacteria-1]|jgi:NADP-dependent alcohol dehydrogenase|uniref:NADH-dependent alcohol dehydrogenase n=1 Tax=Candidatus Wallbacteria bacterium HGW-Wallbacteria-1 TaxID=2013854 RepID=A0A2N1PI73_9BACT|nr:MAG: NADH-dependent alcohol dehydrogenase [Candidatus Wallbacteria bacterium HGW-Wallbacteria-1]